MAANREVGRIPPKPGTASMLGILKNQEETIRQQCAILKQNSEGLELHGKLLEKQSETLESINKKKETQFRRLDQRCSNLESTVDVRCNTVECLMDASFDELRQNCQKQMQDIRRLQEQINALSGESGSSRISSPRHTVVPLAPESGPGPSIISRSPESEGRPTKRRFYTLGFKHAANRKIQAVKRRNRVPAEIAMQHVLAMEQYAGVDRSSLQSWWDQRKRIHQYLANNPGREGKVKMPRPSD